MFTGIDIGGTNTDIALVGDEIRTIKISNTRGIEEALRAAGDNTRLAVSTSQPLNEMVTGAGGRIRTITIPGPGLVYRGAVKGAVSPRGEVFEPVDTGEIEDLLRGCRADGIAIAGKFSVRNPIQEEIVRDIARQFFNDDRIAISAPLGELNFPARITTTRINARIKPVVMSLTRRIQPYHEDFFFVTSDGGLSGPSRVSENPSLLYHSSPATVAFGAAYLSGRTDCLVVDIGGTTTDLVPLKDGKPVREHLIMNGTSTMITTVRTYTIPLGGDSCIRDELMPFRSGNARAFGGAEPTLTDALNQLGESFGDHRRSSCLNREKAEEAVGRYIRKVSDAIRALNPGLIVGTGFLAPALIPRIADPARVPYTVPEHAASANAVGAAVSRISISLHVHADSGRRIITLNGTEYPFPGELCDDGLVDYAGELVRVLARREGAPDEDLRDLETTRYSMYNVVRGGQVQACITDFVISITPGITADAP